VITLSILETFLLSFILFEFLTFGFYLFSYRYINDFFPWKFSEKTKDILISENLKIIDSQNLRLKELENSLMSFTKQIEVLQLENSKLSVLLDMSKNEIDILKNERTKMKEEQTFIFDKLISKLPQNR